MFLIFLLIERLVDWYPDFLISCHWALKLSVSNCSVEPLCFLKENEWM